MTATAEAVDRLTGDANGLVFHRRLDHAQQTRNKAAAVSSLFGDLDSVKSEIDGRVARQLSLLTKTAAGAPGSAAVNL